MIINTGQRTDIPAFYSEWLLNRIREGYVLTRNPFNPTQVSRLSLGTDVVDCISFCTKNPAPMLAHLDELSAYKMLWHVTITPYDKDIEPGVPDKAFIMESFKALSSKIGKEKIFWRYDPVFISEKYNTDFHIEAFEKMAHTLSGSTDYCIISFIDLYEKTKRNFPGIKPVPMEAQEYLTERFVKIGARFNIKIRACCESKALSKYGADTSGCMTKAVIEQALSESFDIPKSEAKARPECDCILGHDIGAYNSCAHGCRYCYANYDTDVVKENMRLHDPASPLLIGHLTPDDVITYPKQKRYSYGQMRICDVFL